MKNHTYENFFYNKKQAGPQSEPVPINLLYSKKYQETAVTWIF